MQTFFNHPQYTSFYDEWAKWRLTYWGGREFINRYLQKFSTRETDEDFTNRRNLTYCPAFASEAVDEIKNSIYQRLIDISRIGGTKEYQEACNGEGGGVDREDSSMITFIGTKVLPEMLTMKKVGIYVDMPAKRGKTKANNVGLRPYLYIYEAEQIQNWVKGLDNQLEAVQLEDIDYDIDSNTGYPKNTITRHRKLWRGIDGKVHVQVFQNGDIMEDKILDINTIPFVIAEIPHSLLQNIADMQIALLNLESSDISSILKGNFIMYVEQGNAQSDISEMIRAGSQDDPTAKTATEIRVGALNGRKYYGDQAPSFINPPSEPIEISMKKQEQIKSAIRQQLNLSVANLAPSKVSAASKEMDSQGLEAGLSFIGQILEKIENKIARIWSEYDGSGDTARIKYPGSYSLKSTEERFKDCKSFIDTAKQVPSNTFKRTSHKMAVSALLAGRVPQSTMDSIFKEIDNTDPVDANEIGEYLDKGLVTAATASEIVGFSPGEANKAAGEKAAKAEALLKSQAALGKGGITNPAARGLPELSSDPAGDKKREKELSQNTENTGDTKKRVRGRGRNNKT